MNDCDCDCRDEGVFSAEAIEMIFDPDYQPQMIPPSVMQVIREDLIKRLTTTNPYRDIEKVIAK